MLKFCCYGFEKAVQNSGKGGISIYSSPPIEIVPIFYLRCRSVDLGDKDELSSRLNMVIFEGKIIDFCYATELPIRYCPWCGKSLQRFYRRTWHLFQDTSIGEGQLIEEKREETGEKVKKGMLPNGTYLKKILLQITKLRRKS